MHLPTMPSFRLDGRRALVTGGSRGLGLAAAAALADHGAAVTLVARGESEVTAAAAAIGQAGGKAEAAVLDVTDQATMAAFIAANGPFQVLFNNAGAIRPALAVDTTPADFDAVMAVNTRAAFFVASAVARGLQATGLPGSIINVSSQMGHVGAPKRAVYSASKHALEGMTKAMAWEWGPSGIRVNTICPTFIETPLNRSSLADPDFRNFVVSNIALGRLGELAEIMGPVVFLASDASSLVTGSALMVDGGWTAM
ncbi:MAG: SDR family oxidoreductase [Azospirillaceae bacterium]